MNEVTRIEPSALAVLSRSEIDGAIATARQFPRDLELYQSRAHKLATLNDQVAAECIYAIPREGKMIEGPSIRLAEILAANWGNCRAGARIIEEAQETVTAQGIFHDLESNTTTTFETRRRIVDKRGRRYSPDMVNMTCNAACAVALRQAILKGIPKPYWEGILKAAKDLATGDERELPQRRQRALNAFNQLGVREERILATLGVKDTAAIGREQLATLQGIYTAIRDGELSPTEAFPEPEQPKPAGAVPSTIEEFAAAADEKDMFEAHAKAALERAGQPGSL